MRPPEALFGDVQEGTGAAPRCVTRAGGNNPLHVHSFEHG